VTGPVSITGVSLGGASEDTGFMTASGSLVATSNPGTTQNWSIVGATTSASTRDIRFLLDNLKIIKDGGCSSKTHSGTAIRRRRRPISMGVPPRRTQRAASSLTRMDGCPSMERRQSRSERRRVVNTPCSIPIPARSPIRRMGLRSFTG
jgi:hypothetical protein